MLKKKKKRKRFLRRRYTVLRCIPSGHQVSWCRGLCTPIEGRGMCGRRAPHDLKGRTQLAIQKYLEREEEEG